MTGGLTELTFHHLGLAVKDDGPALTMLRLLGYSPGERLLDPQQNVHVRLCTSPRGPTVEIVQPGPEGRSPVDVIVSKYSEMIYHTCYETDDLETTLSELRAGGLRVLALAPRRPAVLFSGRHVSFHKVQGFGIVEFLELS